MIFSITNSVLLITLMMTLKDLAPTSLMAWQNRMALDMLLTERGGVCALMGDSCCTFIPNNTAPGGSITDKDQMNTGHRSRVFLNKAFIVHTQESLLDRAK